MVAANQFAQLLSPNEISDAFCFLPATCISLKFDWFSGLSVPYDTLFFLKTAL